MRVKEATRLLVPVLALLLGLSLAACESKSAVRINVGGVTAESDVICDPIVLDNSWAIMAGVVTGHSETPPDPRAMTLLSSAKPMPTKYYVKWVNRRTKRKFEAETSAPEFAEKAETLVIQYAAEDFDKTLIVVIRDNGEIQIWLDARRAPRYVEGFTELLGSFQGVEVSGDTKAGQ